MFIFNRFSLSVSLLCLSEKPPTPPSLPLSLWFRRTFEVFEGIEYGEMAEQPSLFTKIDSSEKKENGTCQLQDSYVQSLLDKTETNQMFEALINNTSVRHSFCKSFTYRLLQPFPSPFPPPPPPKARHIFCTSKNINKYLLLSQRSTNNTWKVIYYISKFRRPERPPKRALNFKTLTPRQTFGQTGGSGNNNILEFSFFFSHRRTANL